MFMNLMGSYARYYAGDVVAEARCYAAFVHLGMQRQEGK